MELEDIYSAYYSNNPEVQKWIEETGIDYDLISAFQYNEHKEMELTDIKKVLAVKEGQKDESAWIWIVELNSGGKAYISGGCDYTGWDCSSWLNIRIVGSTLEALKQVEDEDVGPKLLLQLIEGKGKTWREIMDKELGLK